MQSEMVFIITILKKVESTVEQTNLEGVFGFDFNYYNNF
jgi:hypothetical protein